MQPELPQTYYLDNVQILIEHVERLYHDLLDPQQMEFLQRFQTLEFDAKKLYIRLLNRSQTFFRRSKLNYTEIIDFNAAIEQLADQGCLIVNGKIETARLISLFTKPELLTLFNQDTTLAKLKRTELDQHLREQAQSSLCETLRQQDQLLEVTGKEQYLIFQMLFFGNLNQSMTDFVLSDLGLYQYENYTIDQSHRPYRSQLEIKQHWLLNQLELLIEASDTDRLKNLVELFTMIPDDIDRQSPGYGKIDRLRNQLARQVERIGELGPALDLYQKCRQPPSRERIARILNQQQNPQQSFAACLEIIQQPVDEAEQQFAQAFAARLAKRHQFDSPVLIDPGSEHYELSIIDLTLEQQAPVEIAVALHYDQLDQNESCFYVENSLFNGVLGLLIWDIIFAEHHSAFFHPFQSQPADFYRNTFIERSQPQLDCLWAAINNNHDIYKRVSKRWQTKLGIVNPLVYWSDLSLEIIQLALERIEHRHWMVIFQRILQDLRNNRSGFPDLVRFPADGGYQLIEVKGPGDSLQKNQQRWLQFFARHDIPHCLARVTWLK
ncbi:MAG: hypothetical protein ACI9LO_000351 [Planctomycetota bacterium]|jgi:hypothetical protein